MQLSHEFEVGSALGETWRVLADVEQLARCVPGAEVTDVDGDEHRGTFRVLVGPISAVYRGGAQFEQLDEANHRAVLNAGGRDRGGNGNVRATIAAALAPSDVGGTRVTLSTELSLTGKVVRLAPEIISATCDELFDQFVANVQELLIPPPVAAPPLAKDERDETVAPTAAEVGETAEGGAGSGPAGSSVMGRVVLVVAAVVAGLLMVEVLRLRRRARLLLMPAG